MENGMEFSRLPQSVDEMDVITYVLYSCLLVGDNTDQRQKHNFNLSLVALNQLSKQGIRHNRFYGVYRDVGV